MSKEIRATLNIEGLDRLQELISEHEKLAVALMKNTNAIRDLYMRINLNLEEATIIGK